MSSHRLKWEARIYRDPCRWVCNIRNRLQQPSERAMRITRAAAGRSRSRRPPVRRQFCPCQCRRSSPPSGPRQLSALQRPGTAQSPGQAISRRCRLHGACRCQCNTSSAPADVSKKYAKVMEVDFQRDPWLWGGGGSFRCALERKLGVYNVIFPKAGQRKLCLLASWQLGGIRTSVLLLHEVPRVKLSISCAMKPQACELAPSA